MNGFDTYLSNLRALKTADEKHQFMNNIRDTENEPSLLFEMALHIMQSFKVEDGFIVASHCAGIISEHGTAEKIPAIRKFRKSLPKIKGFTDYRFLFDEAISMLENRAKGYCDCITKSLQNKSNLDPLLETKSQKQDYDAYITTYSVRCKKCDQHWEIEQSNDYHIPRYSWHKSIL